MIKKITSIVIFLSLLFLVTYFVKGHLSEFQNIRFISKGYLFVILICVFIYFLIQGIILKILLQIFDVKLRFKEWFGITMITLMGNYLVPFGGFGFRAAYLKRVYGFKYTHFVSTLGAMYLIEFSVFGLGGLLGVVAVYLNRYYFSAGLLGLFILTILGSWFLVMAAPRFPRFKGNKYLIIFSDVLESLKSIKKYPGLIKKLIWVTFAELIFFGLIFYFSYQAFGFKITFSESFLTAGLSDYAFFVKLLPASFGFYEGAVIYTSRLFGLSAAQGLLVVALTRAAMIFWAFTLGTIFSLIIFKKAKS